MKHLCNKLGIGRFVLETAIEHPLSGSPVTTMPAFIEDYNIINSVCHIAAYDFFVCVMGEDFVSAFARD